MNASAWRDSFRITWWIPALGAIHRFPWRICSGSPPTAGWPGTRPQRCHTTGAQCDLPADGLTAGLGAGVALTLDLAPVRGGLAGALRRTIQVILGNMGNIEAGNLGRGNATLFSADHSQVREAE